MKFFHWLTHAFPFWVVLASGLALWHPPLFTWFSGPLITVGLGIIMLGMGLTLTMQDFRRVFETPGSVVAGALLQYSVMPLLGWGLGFLFGLPTPFAIGLVLVSCCPGGTASNVITYLARANVPLSVTMTAVSTLLAVMVTPALTTLLAQNRVEVNTVGLLLSTFQVVILPVLAGIAMNRFLPRVTQTILPAAPFAAVLFIVLIVASIVGAGRDAILEHGGKLAAAIFLLHAGGFLIGYVLAKIVFRQEQTARTISIEVGMQNSGLGVVLARANFANPLVAIPSAISSVFHSLIGSLLVAVWRRSTPE